MAAGTADRFLDALCRGQSYSVPAVWVQLHVADPGPMGMLFPAFETARKVVTFAPPVGGEISSNTDTTWSPISGDEEATYFTAWDAPAAGTFLFSGSVSASPYVHGDDFTIPAGSLSASLIVTS